MCKGNGQQRNVEKGKEKKQAVFITKEQQNLMEKGAKPLPGFDPENQSLSQFQEDLQAELVILSELETQKEIRQPVFRNPDATLNLQKRLRDGERSAVKAERKEAAKIKDKTYEKNQKEKDEAKTAELTKTEEQIRDPLLLGIRQNELSTLGEMNKSTSARQDLTGRQRRRNAEKYAEVTENQESVQKQAEQDADNLVRNLHMDIMLDVEAEVPEEIKKYNDAYYFIRQYGDRILFGVQKEIARIDDLLNSNEIVQLQSAVKALERAQEPTQEIQEALGQKRARLQELEALQQEYKEQQRAKKQVEALVLMLKGFATNFGALLVQKDREIKALELARDQIRQEGNSAYHTRMIEYLEQKIAEAKNFYQAKINELDTCNGTLHTAKGAALMEAQKKLTALRREMLKEQSNGDTEKVKDLEDQAHEIIRTFAYKEEVPKKEDPAEPLPKAVKKRADVQFKRKGASYYLQKKYMADERSEDEAVRQKAAETVEADEQRAQNSVRTVIQMIRRAISSKDALEKQKFDWLTDQRAQKMNQAVRSRQEMEAEVCKEKGQEMQFTVTPKDLKEVPVPPEYEKFLSFDEFVKYQVSKSEDLIYNKYKDRKDISGKLRRENEKKYEKTNPEKQKVKEAAAEDVENLVNNLRADMILDEDSSLEPDLQQFLDIYYFTREYGEDAINNNAILMERQKAELLRFQLEKNKDTPAEEIRKAEAELKRMKDNDSVLKSFSLASKMLLLGAMDANRNARMLRAMTKAREMIVEEGNSNYHAEMLRQLDERIQTAQAAYDEAYEDLRTLNHKTDAVNKAILKTWNELLVIRRKMKVSGLTDQQKEMLENAGRMRIFNLHIE